MTRDEPAGLLDQNDRVTNTVERIRNGEHQYLVAWDDRRVCRDEYFTIIEYACKQGDCEIVYYADVDEDDLTFDLKRRIERDTKEEEIRKAKRALKIKKERGDDFGRPRFGYTYNAEKTQQIPDTQEFQRALRVIQLRDRGKTYAAINNETCVPEGTIANILGGVTNTSKRPKNVRSFLTQIQYLPSRPSGRSDIVVFSSIFRIIDTQSRLSRTLTMISPPTDLANPVPE
ncbi:hypothetical protein ACFQMM_02575 [Saliphagus sp. GCM10025308]